MNNFAKGSEWRKWDMHIHTPGTAKNDCFGTDAWDRYIRKLEQQDDTVAYGITDYCSIGNYLKVKTIQSSGRLVGKFIFPNIEFRIKPVTGSSTPINLHVLLDPSLAIADIEREFLSKITIEYEGNHYSCTDEQLMAFGRRVKSSVVDDAAALKKGIEQFAVDYTCIKNALSSKALQGHYLVGVANGSRDGASGLQESAMLANRQEIYRMSDFVFSARQKDIEYFLGRGSDSVGNVIASCGSIKPCVRGSDAHSMESIGVYEANRATWIKADPTFEGLKQIIVEPEERVRIQEKSPELDFDKAYLEQICIADKTPVFVEDNDVFLAESGIPLNSGLVSIIGGRGAGKSVLIDYLASGLGMGAQPERYTCAASNISVLGKASVLDEPRIFEFKSKPSVKFIYISQGQIKELIKDKIGFTRNLRETIGVLSDYEIPQTLLEASQKTINEFFRIVKILSPNGELPEVHKRALQEEAQKYASYIENITSEANREKLTNYTKLIGQKDLVSTWSQTTNSLIDDAKEFAQAYNARIIELNRKLRGGSIGEIPMVDVSKTVEFLEQKLLKRIESKSEEVTKKIQDIKTCFASYTGDPSSLLANVENYKKRQTEIESVLSQIANEEAKFATLQQQGFAKIGSEIRNSIEKYSLLIEQTWERFKEGGDDLPVDRKALLHDILREDNLNVRVEVAFDKQAMYDLVMEASYLDKRHFTQTFLERTLAIHNIDDFYSFIEQNGCSGVFSTGIEPKLRQRLIDVFFKKYTSFITHRIIVESNGRPLEKLSHGQKGTVYLRLQIAANLFTETIVYDQPEDDLDNKFITSELVDIFRKIKKYRQIIIVSHNANLVVNADSEQVIVAENEGGVLQYKSGSLENPEIRDSVCNILEGGAEAFARRSKKYSL